VGRVDAFQIDGCVCWFWSRDHLGPHFHVKSAGEWEIRVFFGEEPPRYEVVFEVRRIPRKKLKEILSAASGHRERLFVEWSQKVEVE
jgi:Domain of unknown function (DUF4160)